MPARDDLTLLLQRSAEGDELAFEELLPLVYEELRRLASKHLARERSGHTLQTTALVHEAWLKLIGEEQRNYADRNHFLAIAAMAMRRVLMKHAAKKNALKRGGDRQREDTAVLESVAVFETRAQDLLALDESLKRLEELDPQMAKVVELRFFGGLKVSEAAVVLGVSERTVERHWRLARAWLRDDMGIVE